MTIDLRLLTELITIRRPVQSFAPGTKTPVHDHQVVASGVRARFNPAPTSMSRTVLGQTPKRTFRLFLNTTDLRANDEVVREADDEAFLVTEVRDFFGKHLEAVLEEKR